MIYNDESVNVILRNFLGCGVYAKIYDALCSLGYLSSNCVERDNGDIVFEFYGSDFAKVEDYHFLGSFESYYDIIGFLSRKFATLVSSDFVCFRADNNVDTDFALAVDYWDSHLRLPLTILHCIECFLSICREVDAFPAPFEVTLVPGMSLVNVSRLLTVFLVEYGLLQS